MHVSARGDYAMRAMLTLAVRDADGSGPIKVRSLAAAQELPLNFLRGILTALVRSGLTFSHRGRVGGYVLARPAHEITVGDILRAVSGELSTVRGRPTRSVTYDGSAAALSEVWRSVDDAITDVVDHTTLHDLTVRGLPARGNPPTPASPVRCAPVS